MRTGPWIKLFATTTSAASPNAFYGIYLTAVGWPPPLPPPPPPGVALVVTEVGDTVVRGLIGLEYPPLKQKFTDYKDDYGPPISETIPPPKSRVATKLVHCDIDPQNSKAVKSPSSRATRPVDLMMRPHLISLYRRLPRWPRPRPSRSCAALEDCRSGLGRRFCAQNSPAPVCRTLESLFAPTDVWQ